jgi:hypothetical protein
MWFFLMGSHVVEVKPLDAAPVVFFPATHFPTVCLYISDGVGFPPLASTPPPAAAPSVAAPFFFPYTNKFEQQQVNS